MAIVQYPFRSGGVDLAELQRVVDPTLTATQIGSGSVVVVTTDDTNKESLLEAMDAQGFTPSALSQPVYRRTLDGWVSLGVAASLVDVPLRRWGLVTPVPFLVMRPGLLLGVAVRSDLAASGSDLILSVFVNGVDSGFFVLLPVGATQAIELTGTVPVAAGDLVDLRASTGLLWASLLANLSGQLELED